jgi:hypothetical protein
MSQVTSPFAHSVTVTERGVRIDATGDDAYRWATRPGEAWPCSTLDTLETFYLEFDECGLLDADLPDNRWIDPDELNAYVSDVLRPILPETHPAHLVTVGQFA